jgi:ABC-type transport system substrate-binding protein
VFAQAPTSGGVLIYGRGGDSVSLDPSKETDAESLNVCDNIFDTLLQFKSGSTEVEPGLAESWVISPDKLSYTFKLRKGVKFHDGTDFNADAVLFSFLRQHDPKHEAFGYAKSWQYWGDMGMDKLVKSITKLDDLTVQIRLNQAEAPFLTNLAMGFASIVSPAAVRKHKENFAKNPVGTGPFKFVSWTPNERIILDGYKNFWGPKSYVDRVIIRSIPDNSARLNAFLAKEIHMFNLPTPEHVATVKSRRPEVKVLEEYGLNVGYLAFNTSKAPFSNPKVRQAINMAINKEALIKGVYAGTAIAAVNPIPPSLWGYNKDVKPYPFDVAKAKALLIEAGIKEGHTLELYTLPVARPYMPDGKKVAESIQADLKNIGLNVTLTTWDWGVYLEKTKNGEHQMALMGWNGDNGDPDNFLYVLMSGENIKKPASNIAFYSNPEVTKMLNDAKVQSSQEKRADLYRKAQLLIREDAPWVPIAHSKVFLPVDPKVHDFVMSPVGTRRFNRVWLSKN